MTDALVLAHLERWFIAEPLALNHKTGRRAHYAMAPKR
ncbi:hypothetical protein Ga0451573_003926, partial [Peptococcaceae bacterium DYL19]|nr:hypothetical protein [Phosphitispora fastidiosa]